MTADFEELIDTVIEQKIQLDEVITNLYDYADAVQAFADYSANAADMLKAMLKV